MTPEHVERAAWEQVPQDLRLSFWRLVSARRRAAYELHGSDDGERRAQQGAWLITARRVAWRRRYKDVVPCSRCKAPVLWRTENGRKVPVDWEGRAHACE